MIGYEDLKGMVFGCLGDIEEQMDVFPDDMVDHLMILNFDLASVGSSILNWKKTKNKDWRQGQLQAIKFNLGNFCGYILKVLEKDDISSRDELFGRYFKRMIKFEESFDFFQCNYISALSLMHFSLSNALRDYILKKEEENYEAKFSVRSRLKFMMVCGIGFLRRVMSDVSGEVKGEGKEGVMGEGVRSGPRERAAVNDPSGDEDIKMGTVVEKINDREIIVMNDPDGDKKKRRII